jgi:medium-chain acyl-[acyl-carrier-protein] hydrolase
MPVSILSERAGVERWRRAGAPALRLICCGHAGAGAAAYQPWPAALPASVEVCALRLPGREQLIGTPAFRRLPPLLDWALRVLQPLLDIPFVLFGHSLGALVAFEFARLLRRRGLAAPRALLVSGFRAPHLPPREPAVAAWPDDEFIRYVTQMEGTAAAAFAHAELRALILPALRADFEVLERYEHAHEPPFDFPVHVFGGADDPLVPPQDLAPWAEHTRARCPVHLLPGHHFYLQAQREALLHEVRAALAAPPREAP